MEILNLTSTPVIGVENLNGSEHELLLSLIDDASTASTADLANIAHDIALLADFNGLGEGDEDPFFIWCLIDKDGPLFTHLVAALKLLSKVPFYFENENGQLVSISDVPATPENPYGTK
jgi:hypothetical protein